MSNDESLKFVFNYNRFKFTNDIFFKSIQMAKAEIYLNRFEISIYPYSNYDGIYHVIYSVPHDKGILNTVLKELNGEIPPFDPINPLYIYISNEGNVLKIFDGNLVGIILKF